MNCTEMTHKWLSVPFGKEKLLTRESLIEKANLIKSLLIEEVDEFIDGVKNGDDREIINACSDVLFVANNLSFFAGITPEEVQGENIKVFKSNMTKFCKDREEAEKSKELYATGKHPNKPGSKIEVLIKSSSYSDYPYYLVTPEGKVMKSYNFEDVK